MSDVTKYVWFEESCLEEVQKRLEHLEIREDGKPEKFYSLKVTGEKSAISELIQSFADKLDPTMSSPIGPWHTPNVRIASVSPLSQPPPKSIYIVMACYFQLSNDDKTQTDDDDDAPTNRVEELVKCIRNSPAFYDVSNLKVEIVIKEKPSQPSWYFLSTECKGLSSGKKVIEVEEINTDLNSDDCHNKDPKEEIMDVLQNCWLQYYFVRKEELIKVIDKK